MGLAWTLPDFWDLWKAIAVGLTGLFGIMGLLTTYKDKETGRLTRWGKINLAGIVFSATMGVLSQLVDANTRANASAKSASAAQRLASTAANAATQANLAASQAKIAATNSERTVAQLVRVSQETARIALGTERSVANSREAAQAGQVAASRTLVVARGTAEAVTASKAGLSRVERLLSPFADPTIEFYSNQVDRKLCEVQPKTIEVKLMISRPTVLPKRRPSSESLVADVQDLIKNTDATSTNYEGIGQLRVYKGATGPCSYMITADLHAYGNDLEVLSYLDLPGKSVILYAKGFAIRKADLQSVKIQTKDGQHFYIPLPTARSLYDGETTEDAPEFGVSYDLPADRDPRSRTETSEIF